MKLTPEQLDTWAALVPELNNDADDHMDVAHSADMAPQHTVNFRHAKNAHGAASAIHSLIADLREAREQLASPYMDGYEAAKEEYRPQIIALEEQLAATRKQLAEAQAVIEPYRKDAACWQFARKELSWSRAWFEQIKWAMYIEMDAPNITAERVTDDSVARELDAAVLAAIAAAKGGKS